MKRLDPGLRRGDGEAGLALVGIGPPSTILGSVPRKTAAAFNVQALP